MGFRFWVMRPFKGAFSMLIRPSKAHAGIDAYWRRSLYFFTQIEPLRVGQLESNRFRTVHYVNNFSASLGTASSPGVTHQSEIASVCVVIQAPNCSRKILSFPLSTEIKVEELFKGIED